jgi:hypothetical protein
MPRFNLRRISKIPFEHSEAKKEDSPRNDSTSPSRSKAVMSAKSTIPTSVDLGRPKQPSLPEKVLSSDLEEIRMVNSVPPKSTISAFSGKSPLKSEKAAGSKPHTHDPSFLSKEINSDVISEALIQKERAASRFLSVSVDKGRMIRQKASQLPRQGVSWHSKETKRLSYAMRLKLYQALSKEPMSFLDLHVRFGVSKQTIRRLVKNGFLREVWGPNAIGVRFKLANKSKNHLKKLEAAARNNLKIKEKTIIRLKQRL